MDPDHGKNAAPSQHEPPTEHSTKAVVEPEFSDAELKEMRDFLDGDFMALLNLC